MVFIVCCSLVRLCLFLNGLSVCSSVVLGSRVFLVMRNC